jgi:hypothetical protein
MSGSRGGAGSPLGSGMAQQPARTAPSLPPPRPRVPLHPLRLHRAGPGASRAQQAWHHRGWRRHGRHDATVLPYTHPHRPPSPPLPSPPRPPPRRNIKQYPDAQLVPGILAFRVDAPMYFANVKVSPGRPVVPNSGGGGPHDRTPEGQEKEP